MIELLSDVGGGKTTFVRGLARGAGSDDPVASPTFTISKLYTTPRFAINHLDLYRLGDEPGVIKQELQETLQHASDVVVVEWAAAVSDVLPASRITIDIQYQGNNERRLRIVAPPNFTYMLEDLGE